MAVINAYVNSLIAAHTKTRPETAGYGELNSLNQTFEVAAADDNDSVYRIARIPSNMVPEILTVMCDAITGMSDVNIGFYQTLENGGAIVGSGNQLADALDLSSASKILDGLKDVVIENRVKTVAELLSLTNVTAAAEYDLCLTAIAAASTAGTVTLKGQFSTNG